MPRKQDRLPNNKLKYLRKKNNLKQSDVAELLHITQPNYCNFENNKINLNLDYAIKLARFYHVSIDYLLGLDHEEILISKEEFNHLQKLKEIVLNLEDKYMIR